jgi:hypothetical protein
VVSNQLWYQDTPNIEGIGGINDFFGASLIAGDFNGNGKDDLAIGVWQEDVGTIADAGGVNVIYGSATGLNATGDQLWTQDSSDIAEEAENSDRFGERLAVGDFNGDGRDDLAIGSIFEDIGSIIDAGSVNVIYGSATGLNATGDQLWTQNSSGIEGEAEDFDLFGSSLAVGDFNGDNKDDLAIGVEGEDVGTSLNTGVVNVIYGSAKGLSATGDQLWHQDTPSIEGTAETGDSFGYSLAAGDFNGDGRDDLAIGVPEEDLEPIGNAGAVNVIYGSATGLNAKSDQLWSQNSSSIKDAGESGDLFGFSLASGDFNGDGNDDLAVGVPSEDVGSIADAGAVNVIYGSNTGLSATNNQYWTQNSSSISGAAEVDDGFGFSLAVGDFNGDGRDDLAVGVYGEDIGSITDAGAVNIIYGSATGLTATGNQVWSQNSSDILDVAELYDNFGFSLSSSDFNQDGFADLAIGVSGEDIGGIGNAGAVNVLYGSASGLIA